MGDLIYAVVYRADRTSGGGSCVAVAAGVRTLKLSPSLPPKGTQAMKEGGQRSDSLDETLTAAAGAIGILPGQLVGAYQIVRRIGSGGMADVFLAERADGQFEQRVALKVLRPKRASKSGIRQFERERQIVASLNPPQPSPVCSTAASIPAAIPISSWSTSTAAASTSTATQKTSASRAPRAFQGRCPRGALRPFQPARAPRHQAVQYFRH